MVGAPADHPRQRCTIVRDGEQCIAASVSANEGDLGMQRGKDCKHSSAIGMSRGQICRTQLVTSHLRARGSERTEQFEAVNVGAVD